MRGLWPFLAAGLCAAFLIAAPGLQASSEGRGCKKIKLVTTEGDTVISSVACRVCSVTLIPARVNASATVYDSPDGTSAHGQVRAVAEPSSATNFNSAFEFYGDFGRESYFGLGAYVLGGKLLVHYDD